MMQLAGNNIDAEDVACTDIDDEHFPAAPAIVPQATSASPSHEPIDPALLGLQHSLSTMDLNDQNRVPGHRRTMRPRAERSSATTNRRTIARPRRHSTSGGPSTSGILHFVTDVAGSMAAEAGSTASDGDRTKPVSEKAALAALHRVYLKPTKAVRVKPTGLETIAESIDEDAADADGEDDAHRLFSEQVSFLSVRKMKRSLTFAAEKMNNRATKTVLVQRRRRRIKEKLGRSVARLPKFPLQAFIEKMRALHEEAETDAWGEPETAAN